MRVFNKQVPLFWRKIHGLFHQRRPAGPAGLFRVTIDQALADDLELQDVQCIAWYTHFLILYIYCYHILIVYVFVYIYINRHISTFIQYIVYHICIIYNIYMYISIKIHVLKCISYSEEGESGYEATLEAILSRTFSGTCLKVAKSYNLPNMKCPE